MTDKKPHEESVMDFLQEKRRKQQESIAYARKFNTYEKVRKYTDEQVSFVRTNWYYCANIKGWSVGALSRLASMPVKTILNFLYDPKRRPSAAAQVNKDKAAFHRAQVNAILTQFEEHVDQERADLESSKDHPYTVGQLQRIHFPNKVDPEAGATEEDLAARQDRQNEEKVYDAIDQIIGRSPITTLEVAEAVNHYAKTSGNYMSHSQVIQLRRKYARHHALA